MKKSLGVIILAINEVDSLRECVTSALHLFPEIEGKVVISTSKLATIECLQVVNELKVNVPKLKVHFQTEPFVAAAVLEVVAQLDTDYVIYMSADGETPTELIPELYRTINDLNLDIVSASRWMNRGSFNDYGFMKTILSWSAQKLCKILYNSSLTEFTYGFRIYRTGILKKCVFRETKHPFFVESLLVPLRLGAKSSEIPTKWTARTEGESVASLTTWISYLRPIFRTRVLVKSKLSKAE
jgi:dolichol-phosphate mannosyltransferase